MEGRVFVSTWKKVGDRYRVWVTRQPKLAAEGKTFQEADEELWSVICLATGDGENVREYDPPAPTVAEAAQFLKPHIVTLAGNDRIPIAAEHVYTGDWCPECGRNLGARSSDPLTSDDIDSGSAGGFAMINRPGSHGKTNHYFFSGEFLDLLSPEERSRFEWRRIVRPARAKKPYFELVSSRVHVQQVGVKNLPKQGGWRCESCGYYVLPRYGGEELPWHYVCSSDLPDPLPTCFTIGKTDEFQLCFRHERWRELVRNRAAKGLISFDVGVVPPDRCERKPHVETISRTLGRVLPAALASLQKIMKRTTGKKKD